MAVEYRCRGTQRICQMTDGPKPEEEAREDGAKSKAVLERAEQLFSGCVTTDHGHSCFFILPHPFAIVFTCDDSDLLFIPKDEMHAQI